MAFVAVFTAEDRWSRTGEVADGNDSDADHAGEPSWRRIATAHVGAAIDAAASAHLGRKCGMMDIAVLLGISRRTVQRSILRTAATLDTPSVMGIGEVFEIDEMSTYVGSRMNKVWITYAICRSTRAVVHFVVGNRAADTIRPVTEAVLR